MDQPILKPDACVNCGAEVRPNTQFCFACGKSVTKLESTKHPEREDASLAALEAAFEASRKTELPSSRIDAAAAQRKKARVGQRKPLEIVWERSGINLSYFATAILIFILAVVVVILTRFAR